MWFTAVLLFGNIIQESFLEQNDLLTYQYATVSSNTLYLVSNINNVVAIDFSKNTIIKSNVDTKVPGFYTGGPIFQSGNFIVLQGTRPENLIYLDRNLQFIKYIKFHSLTGENTGFSYRSIDSFAKTSLNNSNDLELEIFDLGLNRLKKFPLRDIALDFDGNYKLVDLDALSKSDLVFYETIQKSTFYRFFVISPTNGAIKTYQINIENPYFDIDEVKTYKEASAIFRTKIQVPILDLVVQLGEHYIAYVIISYEKRNNMEYEVHLVDCKSGITKKRKNIDFSPVKTLGHTEALVHYKEGIGLLIEKDLSSLQ